MKKKDIALSDAEWRLMQTLWRGGDMTIREIMDEVEEETGDVLLDWLEQHPPRRLYFAPGPRVCRIPPRKMARLIALHPTFT